MYVRSSMQMRTIPPEAYTSKELSEAMAWRDTQDMDVQQMTNSTDKLMSVFKRVKRTGQLPKPEATLTNSFQKDLQLETSEPATAGNPPRHQQTFAQSSPQLESTTVAKAVVSPVTPQPACDKTNETKTSGVTFTQLDPRSREMIQEVKEAMNLSRDEEALRLLISAGFNQVKTLFN